MEYYQKAETRTLERDPFPDITLDAGVVHMRVQPQSKMSSLLGFAMSKIKKEETIQMIWIGSGNTTQKATNCAETMRRKVKNLHMLSREVLNRVEEYWEPVHMTELDRLKVNRDIKVKAILLSKTPLLGLTDDTGYYGPGQNPSQDRSASNQQHRGQRNQPRKQQQGNKRQDSQGGHSQGAKQNHRSHQNNNDVGDITKQTKNMNLGQHQQGDRQVRGHKKHDNQSKQTQS